MDFQVSEKTIVGMLISGYDNKWTMDAVTQSVELTEGEPSGFVTVHNDETNRWRNISARFRKLFLLFNWWFFIYSQMMVMLLHSLGFI